MRQIGGKYRTDGDITKNDGTPIPDNEPLMLFRGQDRLLPDLIDQYAEMCASAGGLEENIQALKEKAESVREWQRNNPDSVKTPD